MLRKVSWSLLVLCLLLLIAPVARGQAAMSADPTVYTFVAEWNVPRPQWSEVNANFDKNIRPVLDRLLASGTIVGWGTFVSAVHTTDGATHGTWFSASSIAKIQEAFQQLVNISGSAALDNAKHWDFLARSTAHKAKTVAASGGVLMVSSTLVQPGKGQEWRELWNNYSKPVLDELFANGTILGYSLETEAIHTQDPGWRHVVVIAPTAEGIDKYLAAGAAANEKRSPAERKAIGDAFAAVTVAGAHRDSLSTIRAYAHK